MFYGQFNHQLDDKGRLRIPPTFRKLLGDKPMLFWLGEKCLYVCRSDDFATKIEKIFEHASFTDNKMNMIRRALYSNAQQLEEDKQGRFSISQTLMKKCGFKKSLITVGVGDKIEIWDEDTYNQVNGDVDIKGLLDEIDEREFQRDRRQ